MTNEILVELIQAGENTADNMQKLWEQNRGMIWKLAQQYRNKAEIEDLMQEGFIGLCNAVDAWQPDAGASFLHYAVFWIKQGMRRYIDDCGYTVRIPVGQRERIGKYNRICQQYRAKLGVIRRTGKRRACWVSVWRYWSRRKPISTARRWSALIKR